MYLKFRKIISRINRLLYSDSIPSEYKSELLEIKRLVLELEEDFVYIRSRIAEINDSARSALDKIYGNNVDNEFRLESISTLNMESSDFIERAKAILSGF